MSLVFLYVQFFLAKIRITVDGGTDRWLTWIKSNKVDLNVLASPDLITGDMDSITKSALKYFQSRCKTTIVYTEDQNETDFTKALIETQKFCCCNDIALESIFVFSELSGRFDQLISNLNTLFKARKIIPKCKVYILCPESLIWLLDEGEHTIFIPAKIREEKLCCGLLPIGSPCRVTTTGLKWNLNKTILEFGDLVSSSNTYSGEPVVTVNTDRPIVWTMEIQGFIEEIIN